MLAGKGIGIYYPVSFFEVMLNRRMPNGMRGSVRGERKSPLIDFQTKTVKDE